MAEECPICGSKLVKNKDDEANYYCVNPHCDAKRIESLIHFASRDAMNIEGFGDEIIEDFYNLGYLKHVDDFYRLERYKEELMELEGFGEKSINNLLDSAENSKSNSLEKLLFALGIRYVGAKTGKVLALNFKNIDNLINATYEDLISIKDIGSSIANSLYDYFRKEENIELINKLKALGLNMNYLGKEVIESDLFNGKTFVLTGKRMLLLLEMPLVVSMRKLKV